MENLESPTEVIEIVFEKVLSRPVEHHYTHRSDKMRNFWLFPNLQRIVSFSQNRYQIWNTESGELERDIQMNFGFFSGCAFHSRNEIIGFQGIDFCRINVETLQTTQTKCQLKKMGVSELSGSFHEIVPLLGNLIGCTYSHVKDSRNRETVDYFVVVSLPDFEVLKKMKVQVEEEKEKLGFFAGIQKALSDFTENIITYVPAQRPSSILLPRVLVSRKYSQSVYVPLGILNEESRQTYLQVNLLNWKNEGVVREFKTRFSRDNYRDPYKGGYYIESFVDLTTGEEVLICGNYQCLYFFNTSNGECIKNIEYPDNTKITSLMIIERRFLCVCGVFEIKEEVTLTPPSWHEQLNEKANENEGEETETQSQQPTEPPVETNTIGIAPKMLIYDFKDDYKKIVDFDVSSNCFFPNQKERIPREWVQRRWGNHGYIQDKLTRGENGDYLGKLVNPYDKSDEYISYISLIRIKNLPVVGDFDIKERTEFLIEKYMVGLYVDVPEGYIKPVITFSIGNNVRLTAFRFLF